MKNRPKKCHVFIEWPLTKKKSTIIHTNRQRDADAEGMRTRQQLAAISIPFSSISINEAKNE